MVAGFVIATGRKAIMMAAAGPIDLAFDFLPPAAKSVQARAATMTVRPRGWVVLMGGVNLHGWPRGAA